jgi:hypothetical protein
MSFELRKLVKEAFRGAWTWEYLGQTLELFITYFALLRLIATAPFLHILLSEQRFRGL